MTREKDAGPLSYDFGPADMPALRRMIAFCAKAREDNFFWQTPEPIIANLRDEIVEVEPAVSAEHRAEEIGDMLFTAACLACFYDVDGEGALTAAMNKTARRWQKVYEFAAADGKNLNDCSDEELDVYWKRMKKQGF